MSPQTSGMMTKKIHGMMNSKHPMKFGILRRSLNPQMSKRNDCIKPNKSLSLNQLNPNLVKYTREQMMSLDSISLRKELSHLNYPNIGNPRETLDAY